MLIDRHVSSEYKGWSGMELLVKKVMQEIFFLFSSQCWETMGDIWRAPSNDKSTSRQPYKNGFQPKAKGRKVFL